jgi:hypothetical protein
MDIVLNGICQKFVSTLEIVNEINNLQFLYPKLAVAYRNLVNFLYGGRGWSLSVKIVGTSAPPKKRKVEKGQHPHFPVTKKKTIDLLFAIVPHYHAHKDKDNREDRTD